MTLLLLFLPRLLGVLAVVLQGEQASFGGGTRLWGSATLELLLSAVQAPLRMLAHSVFVVGALTGLRLDWKSPARAAAAVAWRDALARIGVLALPALLLLLLALHGGRTLEAPHLAPLLLPLLLAVPFTVWTGGPALGRVLQRAGLLCVPEERQLPRALQRGVQHSGFMDLAPAPAAAVRLRPAVARGQFVLAMASAALVALVLLPSTALSPELSPKQLAAQAAIAQEQPRSGPSSADVVARASAEQPQRVARYRPASKIDDEVRRRAYEAVAKSLELEIS